MKGATAPILSSTTYEKIEGEEDDGYGKNHDETDPNAIEFLHFDEVSDRAIDSDYRVMEGYAQGTERTHKHLISLCDVRSSQMIAVRISEQRSLLVTSEELTHSRTRAQPSWRRATTPEHSYQTFLTFIDGSLVGGNYDTYVSQGQSEIVDGDAAISDFQGVDTGTSRVAN